ncbi:spinster family MFS transporter [Peristeroidobacter soli]|uniref:spinster family MFS transporter n=1 Tax=Peristeroidobacter soli TaxID=2497877 RepID=UPI00101D371B|nr:MFS transporter [Peristeroidobacter soli]
MPTTATAASRWYVLIVLAIGNAVAGADRAVLAAVLPLLKDEFGFSDTQLGLLTGYGSALSYALLAAVIARVADRHGKSRVIAFCLLLWSASVALIGACTKFWTFAVARFAAGIGPAGVWPVGQALISDHFPPERRSGALAIHTAGDYAGGALPLIAGGWIATHYGWRAAFYAVAIPGIVLAAVQWFTIRDRDAPLPVTAMEPALPADVSWRAGLRTLLESRSFVHIVLGFAWASFAVYGLSQWMPTFYHRQFGLAPDAAASIFGGGYGLGALLGLLLGGAFGNWLAAKDPARLVGFCMVTFLLTFPAISLVLFAPNVTVAFAAHVAAIMFGSMPSGPLYALVQNSVPPHLRAFASSVFLVTLTLFGAGGGPLLIGIFSDTLAPSLGEQSLTYSMFLVKLLGVMLFLHLSLAIKHVRADMAAAAIARNQAS